MDTPVCAICDESFETGLYEIKKKALSTLFESSKQRSDRKHYVFEKLESAFVHKNCQVKYNDSKQIELYKASRADKISEGKRLSAEARTFQIKLQCFICGETFNKYKQQVCHVVDDDLKNRLIEEIKERPKNDYKDLLARLNNIQDLVGACYHRSCMSSFRGKRGTTQRGRPPSEETAVFVKKLFLYLDENKSDCQFFYTDIEKLFGLKGPKFSVVRQKLQEQFPNQLRFTVINEDNVIFFKNSIEDQVWKLWFERETQDRAEERQKIVDMAAKIILEDISALECDTHFYELLNENDEESWFNGHVPSSLRLFLERLVYTNKDKKSQNFIKWKKRVATLAHTLISSVRPRSFLSPILQGLASYLHRKSASRILVDAFSYLGFCSTYRETLRFEASISKDPNNHSIQDNAYAQFIYDNADHNTATLDGKNTWHVMAGCKVITPDSRVTSKKNYKIGKYSCC